MSSIIENNTQVLSEVEELKETASSEVNLLVNDNGVIKQYNLNSHIMSEFSELSTAVGAPKTSQSAATGLYLQFDKLSNDINDINNLINGTEDTEGINESLAEIQEDLNEQKSKAFLEGYCAQFIELSDEIDLLSKNSVYNFPFPLEGLTLANCIRSGSGYGVNLHLNLQYQKDDTEYYLYNTAIINLNVSNSSDTASKIIALYLPGVNATILLQATITGNTLSVTIKDCLLTNDIKDGTHVYVEYGEIEIKKVNFVDTTQDDDDNNNEEGEEDSNILNIPLTLCFDSRDALNSGDASQQIVNTNMLYGSRVKFDHTDIQQGASMAVKYGTSVSNYIFNPSGINTQIKYIGNNLSNRGNILTLNESSDLIPTPQVAYYNADQAMGFNLIEGTWFKYWPEQGQVTNIVFNNYNYNGGVNHQIKYNIDNTSNTVEIENNQYIRIDNYCFPQAQWSAFFASNNRFAFNLNCKNIADQDIKLTKIVATSDTQTIIGDNNNNAIIYALNYIDSTSNGSSKTGIRPGIYIRNDIKSFTISVEIK